MSPPSVLEQSRRTTMRPMFTSHEEHRCVSFRCLFPALLNYCQSSKSYFRDEGMATTKGCPINPAGICHLGLRAADNCKTTKSCVVRCSVIASSIPVTHKLHRALSRDTNRSSSRRSRRHHYRGRAQQRAPFQLPVLRTTPEWLHAKERDHDLRGGTEVMTDRH